MSIAQLRALKISPHLVLVALVLAAVAALALTFAPAKGAAFDARVYFDNDTDDVLAQGVAVASANTSATANDAEDTQAGAILSTGTTPAEGTARSLEVVTETGLAVAGGAVNIQLSVTLGRIGAANGPQFTNIGAAASATATHENTIVPIIFGAGDVGVSTVAADNTNGAGANVPAALTLVGPVGTIVMAYPVVDRLIGASDAGTLGEVGTANATADGLGAGDCGGAVCVGITVTDTLGVAYPATTPVLWSSSNPAAGNFTFSATTAQTGLIGSLNALGGGDDGAIDAGESAIGGFTSGTTPGVRTTITASIGGVNSTLEVIIHGTLSAINLAVAHVASAAGAGADATAVVAGGQVFAAGQLDTTIAGAPPLNAAGVPSQDEVLATYTATDAAGQPAETAAVPFLTDTTAAVVSAYACGGAGLQADGGDENNPSAAISVLNAIGAAGTNGQGDAVCDGSAGSAGPVSLGTHTLQANVIIGTTNVQSNLASVLVSGVAASITVPSFTINTAQATSLAPGATATVTVNATDAAGNIVPDGSLITFNATGGALWTNGLAAITPAAGTTNGIATATLLPTGTAINSTVTAFAAANPTVANSSTIQMVVQQVGALAATSVGVTAGSTELEVGDSTTVTAIVSDQNDAAMANQSVRFTEGVATAAIDGNVKLTDASGGASSTFTADEPGVRRITATVVNIIGGVIVETAVSGSVDITVTGAAEPEAQELSLRAGGQFVFWSGGDQTASAVFGTVKIAWLFDEDAIEWTSFIPALGITDWDLVDGAILWVVSETAQTITF